jgi:hypothetical protein
MGLCLRRLMLQYPWRGGRVRPGISGNFQPESVATFAWNRWQGSTGISGNLRAEYAPLMHVLGVAGYGWTKGHGKCWWGRKKTAGSNGFSQG